MAATTQQPITKASAAQGVVTIQTIDPIHDVAVTAQPVGAGRGTANHHLRLKLPQPPSHPVAEAEALHPIGGTDEEMANPHRVTAAVADHQIGIKALDDDLGGGDIQPAEFILKAVPFLQRVAAITEGHHIEIMARPSAKEVIARAALENIIPL